MIKLVQTFESKWKDSPCFNKEQYGAVAVANWCALPQATQAHDLPAVLFSIFIDFVWEIHFGSKSYKM